jgi:hypothetical protein
MQNWTPDEVFLATFVAASLSGLAVLFKSKEPISPRSVFATILYYGATGCGLGMIAYEWLGGKQAPWRAIGCGWLVGIKAISLKDIKKFVQRILGNDDEDPKKKS